MSNQATSATDPAGQPTARNCGTCTLCCKLLAVEELDKPPATLCRHCEAGRGCRIYESRPGECRAFHCYFLQNPQLGEQWRPSKSRIVLVLSPDRRRISANVDPDRPDAWRREPFYATLKQWAREAVSRPDRVGQVLVTIGKRTIAILPDRNIEVGIVEKDDVVVTRSVVGPRGIEYDVVKLSRDDPQARSVLASGGSTLAAPTIF